MGARTKLNQAYVNGAAALAALIGLSAGSWTVFIAALVFGVASNVYSGGIRTGRRRLP